MPRVRSLMTIDVPLTTPNTPVSDAARLMAAAGRDSLVVFDLGKAVGIVTERDFITKVVAEGRDPFRVHVRDIVSAPLISISPERSAAEAAALMLEKKIRQLPVMKDDRLIGMITMEDFARHVSKKGVRDQILESMGRDAELTLPVTA